MSNCQHKSKKRAARARIDIIVLALAAGSFMPWAAKAAIISAASGISG